MTRTSCLGVSLIFLNIFIILETKSVANVFKGADEISGIRLKRTLFNEHEGLSNWNVSTDISSVTYGECDPNDVHLHTENFIIETEGPSTLSGVFEFYLDLPAIISCIEIQDKGDTESKSDPVLSAGGPGHDWLAIKVKGNYGKGIYVQVKILGTLKKTSLLRNS